MSAWDASDLTLPEVSLPRRHGALRPLALTILFHPDSSRIGDAAELPLQGNSGAVGRLQPVFIPPRAISGRPLEDPYLSRTPVEINTSEGQLCLRAPAAGSSLCVNGSPVRDSVTLSLGALERGVVLALAHRVVLLLHHAAEEPVRSDTCGMVGEHDALQRVRELVERVAGQNAHVLLLGESGTGKELAARAIHQRSPRGGRPMVTVNMAAIPPELAAAELFGVRRGAFTGAEGDRAGYFSEADGGILFLDEIGACDGAVQPQLLRVLQQGEIQRPGGGTLSVDVRVLAATDAGLDTGFSTALRHRLGSLEVLLPPLRERIADLGRLMVHFLPAQLLEAAGVAPAETSRWVELVSRMAMYGWPGNVRELANACGQLAVASHDGLRVPDSIRQQLERVEVAGVTVASEAREAPSDQRIRDAMLAARWEVSRAARELEISRQALYRRIEAIPELRTASDIPAAEVTSAYQECRGDLEQAALRLQVSRAALKRRWRAMDLQPGAW